MRLFIAEKPNMGKTIAGFLPGPHTKHRDHIETGGGIVTWCVGHLLEQAEPGAYGEKWAKFPGALEDLPIVPDQWKLVPVDGKKDQVETIRRLLKQCTEVVHAGDPGREGQLIVDEMLEFCGNRKPVQRILLNALDKATVMKALASLQPNSQFQSLYQAALGRQRADWMVGMNLSRAYTILGQKQNYRGVLPIGRVQTPTLAIVVRRDEEIENFVAKDFFSVHAQFKTEQADFWTTWLPPGNTLSSEDEDKEDGEEEEEDASASTTPPAAWQDEQRRVIDKAVADKVAADVRAAGFGTVVKAERKPVDEQAPILFELSTLQTELNGSTGAGVKDILAACQTLYERGHVSYPRTDCAYMPESQHGDAPGVLAAISGAVPALAAFMPQADATRKSRVFDDKKMVNQEHHAIVPTASAPDLATLSSLEKALYEAVARRYLAQFLPVCEVDKSLIEVDSAGHRFAVRGRIVRVPGWRVLFAKQAADPAKDKKEKAELPAVTDGQRVDAGEVRVDSHRTTPPARYTQGTLLRAMKHVHLLVTDPAERKKLKSVEGIGRAATRAAIVENLLKRGLLQTEKNKLRSSSVARILVKNAPRPLVDPGLTARWETALDAVASGQVALSLFEQKQLQWIQGLLTTVGGITLPPPPPEAAWTPGQGGGGNFKGRSGSGKGGARKSGGASAGPRKPPPANAPPCPKCGNGVMIERQVKAGPHQGKTFKGCTNYPECKHSEWPK